MGIKLENKHQLMFFLKSYKFLFIKIFKHVLINLFYFHLFLFMENKIYNICFHYKKRKDILKRWLGRNQHPKPKRPSRWLSVHKHLLLVGIQSKLEALGCEVFSAIKFFHLTTPNPLMPPPSYSLHTNSNLRRWQEGQMLWASQMKIKFL